MIEATDKHTLLRRSHVLVTHGNLLKLGGSAQDLQQRAQLGLFLQRLGKHFDGGVPDVVESGNHTQVERVQLGFLLWKDRQVTAGSQASKGHKERKRTASRVMQNKTLIVKPKENNIVSCPKENNIVS